MKERKKVQPTPQTPQINPLEAELVPSGMTLLTTLLRAPVFCVEPAGWRYFPALLTKGCPYPWIHQSKSESYGLKQQQQHQLTPLQSAGRTLQSRTPPLQNSGWNTAILRPGRATEQTIPMRPGVKAKR